MANNNGTTQTSDISGEVLKIAKILDGVVKSFRRFWWIVLLLVVVGAGAFWMHARTTFVAKYQAYSSFAISASSSYGTTADYYNQRAVKQLNNTFPYIISSGVLMQAVADDLGVWPVPATVSTDSVGSTAIFTIRVTANDPEMAYNVLQSVIRNYPRVADVILGNTIMTQIDESGVPTYPINSSGTRRKAIMGGLLGLAAGIILLLFLSIRRRTVITEQDIKEFISLPMLGTVPEVKFKKRGRKTQMKVLIDKNESGQALAESMHSIRTRLISELKKNDIHSFLISSALAGEGKTTFAANLSISLARHGYKVILIDGANPMQALVVSLTMALTILVAKFVGCTLPILAKRIGLDPAVMAAPFITTIVDALSLLVYCNVAAMLLGI